jgi:hypothetical protein
MVGTCPPHHWVIGMRPVRGAFPARCKKCGRKRTYPAGVGSDLEKAMTVRVSKKTTIKLESAKKAKRTRPGRPQKWESIATLWGPE